jgi:predicted dienelactone hydrolase
MSTTKPLSAADKLKAKADRLKNQASQTPAPSVTAAAGEDTETSSLPERHLPSAAPVLAKPIRSTVDLSPARHRSLKAWSAETATEIGRARVTTQEVINALVHRMLTDETLARKIRDDLRTDVR